MTGPEPFYMDQHGRRPEPDSGDGGFVGALLGGLDGREPLWRVFWFFFLPGHGVFLGIGGGLMILAMVVGLAVDPLGLNGGASGLAVVGTLIGVVLLLFVLWSVVALWRCAYNCRRRRWGHAARALSLVYGGAWAYALSLV